MLCNLIVRPCSRLNHAAHTADRVFILSDDVCDIGDPHKGPLNIVHVCESGKDSLLFQAPTAVDY